MKERRRLEKVNQRKICDNRSKVRREIMRFEDAELLVWKMKKRGINQKIQAASRR